MSSSESVGQRLFISINPKTNINVQIQRLHDAVCTVEGFHGLYWGRFIENPSRCEILCCAYRTYNSPLPGPNLLLTDVVWKSTEHQDKFPETPQRPITDGLFMKMSTNIPKCHYLPLRPWESVISAPVVEMLSFSRLADSIDLEGASCIFNPLIEYIRGTEGCLKIQAGPTTQYGDGPDQKRFLITIGWESIEAHEKGKKPEGFATLPMDIWKKAEVHHVKWEKVESVSERSRL
jgi:hypothetical protein